MGADTGRGWKVQCPAAWARVEDVCDVDGEAAAAAAAGAQKGRRRGSCVEAGGELVGVADKG
jgi:hypothetical protein